MIWIMSCALIFIHCGRIDKDQATSTGKDETNTLAEGKPKGFLRNVDVSFAKGLIMQNKDLIIIDVRTPEENAEGGIPNSRVIDVQSDDFEQKLTELDKEATYLVYCRSGRRSSRAVKIMEELGFQKLYMMEGGFLDWEDSE